MSSKAAVIAAVVLLLVVVGITQIAGSHSRPAVTITGTGIDPGMGEPYASFTLTNNGGNAQRYYLEMTFQQDGRQIADNDENVTVASHTTYLGQLLGIGQVQSGDPITAQIVSVQDLGTP